MKADLGVVRPNAFSSFLHGTGVAEIPLAVPRESLPVHPVHLLSAKSRAVCLQVFVIFCTLQGFLLYLTRVSFDASFVCSRSAVIESLNSH